MAKQITLKNKNKPAGRNVGSGTGVNGSAAAREGDDTGGAKVKRADGSEVDGSLVVKRKHTDWIEHELRWRWLQDSYEGGDRYRNAVYGPDRRGLPCRNLFRHKREYPDPQQFPNQQYMGVPNALATQEGTASLVGGAAAGPWPGQLGADPAATAQDDDYELRRARTPIPEFVAEAVEIHLAKVYDQEVSRNAPADVTDWWLDVDGRGTPIDDYMRETISPLLLVLGCLDVCLDHPKAPPGEKVVTRADELRLGLDKVVASYILPQNLVWWRVDAAGRYCECLVREYVDPSDRIDYDEDGKPVDPDDKGEAGEKWRQSYVRFRLWSATESILFNNDGSEVIEHIPHAYGRVPIVRLMDAKKHRTPHVGKSRYEAIAEYQREFYNRDSELILSDTLQAHPFLSGPDDYCKADNTMSVGPGYIIPMKKNVENGTYQGWEYVTPPKDPAESLRKNKCDIVDAKDRRANLTKPAGVAGTGGDSVGQSGISKQLDGQSGHKLLTAIARSLAKNERFLAEYAAVVLRGRQVTPEEAKAIDVVYPARFDLYSADELTDGMTKLQAVVGASGELPETEAVGIKSIVRQLFLGLQDFEYKAMDAEIDLVLASKATLVEQGRSLKAAGISDAADALAGGGSEEEAAGTDPTGQAGGTAVSGATITGSA
jgi:hypothetical protein